LLQRLCLVSAPCCCVSSLFQYQHIPPLHPTIARRCRRRLCRVVSLLMSHLIQSGQRAPSPGAGNFASNNPFRRAASPLPSPDHRMSNNPFLDPPAPQRQAPTNSFTEDIFVRDACYLLRAPPSTDPPASFVSHKPQHCICRLFSSSSYTHPKRLVLREYNYLTETDD
jgi:hypothetical protein